MHKEVIYFVWIQNLIYLLNCSGFWEYIVYVLNLHGGK